MTEERNNEANFEELNQNTNPETNTENQNSETKDENSLEAKVKEQEGQIKELNDKLLRTFAELDNTRRRGKEEVEKSLKYGISKFAQDLIPIVENFYLAIDNAPKEKIEADSDIKTYADGIELTQKELLKAFEKHGVKRIFPMNEKFDHNFHQAVVQMPSKEEEGIIVQVIQSGYTIGERLLRPALVGVSKGEE